MMERLVAAAAKMAAKKATEVADALVEAARTELPKDVSVEKADRSTIVIAGRALLERALTEAALRGLAALAKAIR